MSNNYNKDYYNDFWEKTIKQLPRGGSYRFDYRISGFNIIKDVIPNGSKVFDYACGLAHISIALQKDKDCKVHGCDMSKVAVDYVNQELCKKDAFKVTDWIFGDNYDTIIASQYLEHLKDPKKFIKDCLKVSKQLIVALPNNFRKTGEHTEMQWTSWDEFYKLFQDWDVKRIDEGKYTTTPSAWCHPIFIIKDKKEKTMHPKYREEDVATVAPIKRKRKAKKPVEVINEEVVIKEDETLDQVIESAPAEEGQE